MFQYSNRTRTILARNITVGDTTLIAASGTGAEFPSPAAPGDAIALTLVSASNSRHYEIVYCVQRNGDTFTVWRGQEGTTPLPFQSGDLISLNMTAALYRRMAQAGYLGQFSQEVAQSPSAYRKGAIVCDGTDTAVYWISLEDQNGTTPGEGNTTWMRLSLPELLQSAGQRQVPPSPLSEIDVTQAGNTGQYQGESLPCLTSAAIVQGDNGVADMSSHPVQSISTTLDYLPGDGTDLFFIREEARLAAKILQDRQAYLRSRDRSITFQQAYLAEQKQNALIARIEQAASKLGLSL